MDNVTFNNLDRLISRRPELAPVRDSVAELISDLVELYHHNGTLFLAGNGGSAADADHICGELLKGFCHKRPLPAEKKAEYLCRFGEEGAVMAGKLQQGLRAVSLLSHPGLVSAFANDVDPALVYAQQLQALARPGDIFIGISTGGGAVNIRHALMAAKVCKVKSYLLTGAKHGICERYADVSIAVPEKETYLIQEQHIAIYHAFCLDIEENMFC